VIDSDSRWIRIKDLFSEAIELAPESRAEWIARTCADDISLRRELEALIQSHDQAGGFMERGALDIPEAAKAVVEATQSAVPATVLPTRFGGYRIVRELGRGGMGVVYLGARDDDRFEKLVAIKVIAGDLVDPMMSGRFLEERRILASLDHPDIARLLDAGTSEAGAPYVVMEYVEGVPIDVYCAERHLSVRERLALFGRVCEAVQYSHERLVVHRDIKARNILVTRDGAPKLLDFGIAKLLDRGGFDRHATRTTFRALTPESASPEQVRGDRVAVSADVYSLGVLLYRLLSGRSPYRGDMTTESGVVQAICDEEPLRPSDALGPQGRGLRGDLDLIVLKALRKDAARRYSTVEQFARDITRHLAHLPVLARPDSLRYRTTMFIARHTVGVAAAALVILSLAGGVTATAWQAHVARVERARADRRFADVRRLANSFLFEFHDAIEKLPGSTKARELVVRRATEYLDSLSKESAHDASLDRELAASYEKVGDVQGLPQFANLGDTPGALRSHRSALALRRALAAADPSDPALQLELAATLAHTSTLLEQTRDFQAALDHGLQSLAIREALLARNPGGEVERRSLAIGYHNIGAVMIGLENWSAALDNVQKETRMLEAILAADRSSPRAQRDLGIAYKSLGALLEKNGDQTAALAKYRDAVALDEVRVHADPNDGEARLDLSYGYASLGYSLSTMRDVSGALENYERALALREQVADADVHDANAQQAVSRAHFSIGNVLRSAGRRGEAIQHLRQALEIDLKRYLADPGNGAAGERLASVYGAMAGTAQEQASATKGKREAARYWRDAGTWAQKSIDIWSARRTKGPFPKRTQDELDALRILVAKSEAALH
jgi:non-specific serine/threonine protein kinase/serine/threonine-protein kinase